MVQPIRLIQALQVSADSRLAIVGAGGKTTLMFRLARELSGPVVLSTSTHLALEQAALADLHFTVNSCDEIAQIFGQGWQGSALFTGVVNAEKRLTQLAPALLECLERLAQRAHLPVILEADGSRRLPIKAPAEFEPAIPAWANQVVVVAGLSGLGRPLTGEYVHRPERFAELTGLALGQMITAEGLAAELGHALGGLKNIPAQAQKFLLLNQADDTLTQAGAGRIAQRVVNQFSAVVVAQLQDEWMPVKAVYSTTAAVVLAAGKSSRMVGHTAKVLLDWQGEAFVHAAARKALQAGLSPVVVVTGAHAQEVKAAVSDLPVQVVENAAWAEGQSTSLIAGLKALPSFCAGVIFLLADQPQVTPQVLQALVELHQTTQAAIIAPQVEGQRANPVLFDRVTFPRLLMLQGDTGGRALFSQFAPQWLPWNDGLLLLDVDTPEDLQELRAAYAARLETHGG